MVLTAAAAASGSQRSGEGLAAGQALPVVSDAQLRELQSLQQQLQQLLSPDAPSQGSRQWSLWWLRVAG